MQYKYITTSEQLKEYCRALASCKSIAFDTEFVSEHTYRPVLCLVQVSADNELAEVDLGRATPRPPNEKELKATFPHSNIPIRKKLTL